jgi:hypothetical protein
MRLYVTHNYIIPSEISGLVFHTLMRKAYFSLPDTIFSVDAREKFSLKYMNGMNTSMLGAFCCTKS